MSYRRRHRWFRQMALGLAFSLAVFAGRASVAAAQLDEGTNGVSQSIQDPYLTDVFVRPGEALGGPDGAAVAFANAIEDVAAARPDDLASRFAHSDVAARPELASSGSTFEWNEALALGIGAVVLALGLGLAVGYLRRPRIAGL